MKNSNREMEKILSQDIQISDIVENRLQDTYFKIEMNEMKKKKSVRSYRKVLVAAALIFALTGTTAFAAYVSDHKELLDSVFGTKDRVSQGVKKHEIIYDERGGGSQTIESETEFIPMDEEKAKMIEPYITKIGKEVKLGKHKLTILDHVTDGHAGIVSYKLECSDGVDMMEGDEDAKEEYVGSVGMANTSKFGFDVVNKDINGNNAWSHKRFGIKKSTKNCYYITESYVCDRISGNIGVSCFEMDRSNEESQKLEVDNKKIKETFIPLIGTGTEIPTTKVLGADNKNVVFEYSPIGLSVDLNEIDEFKKMAKENGGYLETAWANRFEINYSDGTKFVVYDRDKYIDNTNCFYEMIGESGKTARFIFNRVIDPKKVESITINDKINIKVK